MKPLIVTCLLFLAALPVIAAEPDGLTLPPGFHATVVAEGLGSMTRHMAFGDASHLYVSTAQRPGAPSAGIIALQLDAHHRVKRIEHFSSIDDGTAIAVYKGALFAASPHTLYRIALSGRALVPTAKPQAVVVDVPGRAALAFDNHGGLYLAVGGSGNTCVPKDTPRNAQAQGLMPCPDLATRAGVWRFNAGKLNQEFADGAHVATGIRDTNALAWSATDKALYVVNYGRDGADVTWPKRISAEDAEHISDGMYKVTQGTNMGWPYTYYDYVRQVRLLQPEYGGDDSKVVSDSKYAVPVAAFHAHIAPMDIAFYQGRQFPLKYRGGAFIAFHGAAGCDPQDFNGGYDVMFVPMNKSGKAGSPEVFADGFAGPTHEDRCGKRATYRPVDVTVGPDGALYVADSQKGRIWRIAYGDN
ncbi:MAG: PQQ-dependent sugar dehydrogenase [Steroidobacteraceae bacterium]